MTYDIFVTAASAERRLGKQVWFEEQVDDRLLYVLSWASENLAERLAEQTADDPRIRRITLDTSSSTLEVIFVNRLNHAVSIKRDMEEFFTYMDWTYEGDYNTAMRGMAAAADADPASESAAGTANDKPATDTAAQDNTEQPDDRSAEEFVEDTLAAAVSAVQRNATRLGGMASALLDEYDVRDTFWSVMTGRSGGTPPRRNRGR